MYVCLLVEDSENLCFWMGSFIYFSIIIVKTQSREAQPWWSHHLWYYSIVKAWYTANKLLWKSIFPRGCIQQKSTPQHPVSSHITSVERELPSHKGDVMDIFCPHPWPTILMRPSWCKMPIAHYAGLFSNENLWCQDTSAGVDPLHAFPLTLRNMNLKLHLRMI